LTDPLKVYAEHTWETFVRPAVRLKANEPDSRALILEMMPYFPKACVLIAAFLDDEDQFWKVNYHWELLSARVKKALGLTISAESRLSLETIKISLDANPPDPLSGYTASAVVGQPVDRSTHTSITERWTSLRVSKKAFQKVLDAESIPTSHPPAAAWFLAAAPVAAPGTSKHGTGYAFDISGAGKNLLIKSISKQLGATLVFDEKSHVHVEFKQGVLVETALIAEDWRDGRWSGWRHAPA
jgi:hypothetical protein